MTRIIDQTEATTVADGDVLPLVASPFTTPLDRYITRANLLGFAFGSISTTGGVATQALSATTWTKVTQFTAAYSGSNVTASHADDKITVAKAGAFEMLWQCSFSGTAAGTYQLAIRWDGSAQSIAKVKLDGSGSVVTVTVVALVSVISQPTDVEAWVWSDGANNFSVVEQTLTVKKLN